jgi:serine/threonine protein kinase
MSADLARPFMDKRQVGQYILEEKLGQGGMAEVWKSRHRVLGTCVAIKFLIPGFAGVPEIEQRFLGEGKRQAQLSHPNIVSTYDFLYENERSYLIMRLIEGENLDDRLYKLQGPMDLQQVLAISTDVLRALDFAHSQHVIHRDIKPSNILIDQSGRAFVMDFGIALVMGEQRATRAGMAIGTPHYMSPEQIIGSKDLDHRSDIYSYGCVLFYMLAGVLPFEVREGEGQTDFAIQTKHLNETPRSLRQLNPNVPEYVEQAVLRCLEKKADDRFNSCQDLLSALTNDPTMQSRRRTAPLTVMEAQSSQTPRPITGAVPMAPARETIPPPQAASQPHKSGNLLWIVLTLLLAVVLLGGGFYWYTHRGNDLNTASNAAPSQTAAPPATSGTGNPAPTQSIGQTKGSRTGSSVRKPPKDTAPKDTASSGPSTATQTEPSVPAQNSGVIPDSKPTQTPTQPPPQPPPPAPAPTLAGRWTGQYKNETTGQGAQVSVQLSDRSDMLSGIMSYDVGGRSSASCSVSGIYNATNKFMYLEIANCQGRPPSYLPGRMGFVSVNLDDRQIRGIDRAHNSWLEISKP